MGCAGIHNDHVDRPRVGYRTVRGDDLHVRPPGEVGTRPPGQFGVDLGGDHLTVGAGEFRDDCGVVTDAGTDMTNAVVAADCESEVDYDSARRRMRRAMLRAGLSWGTP